MTLKITEVFDSIQGEGPHMGQPATFVRVAGCNLKCPACDTKYSWGKPNKVWTPLEIYDELALGCGNVVLTGGEPLTQQNFVGQQMYHPVHTLTIETNGTIRPPKSLSLNSDVKWSVSPKMDWFNPEYPLGEFEANVDAFHAVRGELWWKFAVRLSGYDVAYVKRFVEQYKLRGTIVLQLMNEQLDGDVDKDEYLSKLRNLAEMVATRHHFTRFRVLPQLHVLLWGGRKGV